MLAAVVIAATAAAAGCTTNVGGSTDTGAGSGTATSGELTVFWKGSEKAGAQAVIKSFEKKYPKAEVNLSTADVEQYQATLRTQLSAGTAADVLFVWPAKGNPAALADVAPGGYLEDLSDKPWVKKYPESISELATYQDKTYLMLPAVTSFGPWYNDDALSGTDLRPPEQWSDVLPFCRAAKKAGKVAYALGAATLNNTQNPLYGLVPDLVYGQNKDFDSDRDSGGTTFASDSGWNAAMQRYQQMNRAGCFTASSTGVSQDQQNKDIADGKALGMFGIGFQVGAVKQLAPDTDFTLHPFSGDDDKATDLMTVSNAGGAGVNAKAKNKELAETFVDYLATPEGLGGYNDASDGTVPAIPTGETYSDPSLKIINEYLSDDRSVHFLNQFWPNARIEQAMYSGVQAMLAGKESPRGVLEGMDKEWSDK